MGEDITLPTRRRLVGFAAGAILVADFIAAFTFAAHASREMCRSGPTMPPDLLVVFYSAEGANFERRITFAADQVLSGQAQHVIVVGGARPGRGFFGSEVARERLIARGLPPPAVFSERRSNDTFSNLEAVRMIVASRGFRLIALASDPLHLLRIRRLTRHDAVAPEQAYICRPFAMPRPLQVWYRAHWEWLAAGLARILPNAWYRAAIDRLRRR